MPPQGQKNFSLSRNFHAFPGPARPAIGAGHPAGKKASSGVASREADGEPLSGDRLLEEGQHNRPHVHDLLAGDGQRAQGQRPAALLQPEGSEPQGLEVFHIGLAIIPVTS